MSLALVACNGESSKGTEDPSSSSGPTTDDPDPSTSSSSGTPDPTTAAPTTEDPDPTADPTTEDPDPTADPTTEDPDPTGDPMPACVEDDFMAEPFAGPGWDHQTGLLEPVQDTYIVSTTVLSPRPEKGQEFMELVGAMVPVLLANPGLVGFSLGGSAKCGTARTLAVWRNQEAMMNFVVSPEHVAGISAATEISLTGTVTAWEAKIEELPIDWDTAREKLADVPPSY